MPNPLQETLLLEIRGRLLGLAADLDRLGRAGIRGTAFLKKVDRALGVLASDADNRAERVQMIFSDVTPPPQ